MLRLIVTRCIGGVLVLFCVFTFSFFMLRAAPGGPFTEEREVSPEVMRNIEKRYNFDWPLWKQYLNELRKLASGDLGESVKRNRSVMEIIRESFPVSLHLGVMALAFSVLFGTFLGVFAAVRQNTWFDHGAMAVALFGISIPSFVLGPILIMVFSLVLAWLPPARYENWTYMILPAATLGLIYMGVVARLARGGLLETMRQDYIRTARAKGLSERVVVWKHAVRLGIMPVVTFLGPATAALITGSFVVEKIFQLPGLGFYFVASINDRDYPVLSGVLVFYAIFLVVLNLVVDIAYGILDPRIRDKR